MRTWLAEFLIEHGVAEAHADVLLTVVLIGAIALLSWIADIVARNLLVRGVQFIARRTESHWDDALVEHRFFSRLAQLAPAIVIYLSAAAFGSFEGWVERVAMVYMLAVGLQATVALLDAGLSIYQESELSAARPIRGYVQVAKLVLYLLFGILMVATLLDRDPWGLLAGLGALSAVLLLVFRDTILGLVASVQLSTNDMLRRGDWVEIPSYGADGDVIEVGLHTVKVQNWDKTISTIPTHALINQSFKNWRGMTDSGGRRIKRSVLLDLNTIRFCDDEMLERFARFDCIADYIRSKREALSQANRDRPANSTEPINTRRLTNVGTFRAYIETYLRDLPKIHDGMTFLVRQLAPTEKGLPIEIYVFSSDQAWVSFEALQSDIFDHILAVLPEFDLRAYQAASGSDLRHSAEVLAAR